MHHRNVRFFSSLSQTCGGCQSWNGHLCQWHTLQAPKQHLLPPSGYSTANTEHRNNTLPSISRFWSRWALKQYSFNLNHFVLNSLLGESYELERWNKELTLVYLSCPILRIRINIAIPLVSFSSHPKRKISIYSA